MLEAPPRFDRRTDDDEFRTAFGRNARDLLAEASRPRADDLPSHRDAVRTRDRSRALEPLLQAGEHAVHVGVQRQLAVDHQRPDENDARAAIGSEPAGEVESVLRLPLVEQRHDDAPVGDRPRPACEVPRTTLERPDVGQLHLMSW